MNRLADRSEAATAALLTCAREHFGSEGYASASLDALAREAGMTKGAVYHHFGSKAALFDAVFRAEQRALVERVTAGARSADAARGIARGVRSYLDAMVDDPRRRRILLLDGPAVLGWERWHRCEEPGFRTLLTAGFEAVRRGGRLAPGLRAEDAATLLLGALTEAALSLAEAADPRARARRLEHAFRALLAGLVVSRRAGGPAASA